ncbi:MAG: hypothetical protein ACOH1N_07635 [Lutibacter sp.]
MTRNPWIILQTVSQEQITIQSKMLDKIMDSENGRMMLMDKIHNNKMMEKKMKPKDDANDE